MKKDYRVFLVAVVSAVVNLWYGWLALLTLGGVLMLPLLKEDRFWIGFSIGMFYILFPIIFYLLSRVPGRVFVYEQSLKNKHRYVVEGRFSEAGLIRDNTLEYYPPLFLTEGDALEEYERIKRKNTFLHRGERISLTKLNYVRGRFGVMHPKEEVIKRERI